MGFIDKLPFVESIKNKSKRKSSSLSRRISRRSIFNNDRLVPSAATHASTGSDKELGEEEEEEEEDDGFDSNKMIFQQTLLSSIKTSQRTQTAAQTKTENLRPTHQLHSQHQQKSNTSLSDQLLSLSFDDSPKKKQIKEHAKDSGFQLKTSYKIRNNEKVPFSPLESNQERKCYREFHHKQEKMAMVRKMNDSTTLFDVDSSLYAPFVERPEVLDNDYYYIPLPTVTRKYIDPPAPDILLDSIPSYPLRDTIKEKNRNDIPPKKIRAKLIVDTKRHSLGNGQMDRLLSHRYNADLDTPKPGTPDVLITSWLSRNAAMETLDISQQGRTSVA